MAAEQDHRQEEYANNSVPPTDHPPYQPMQPVEGGDNSRSKSTITLPKGDDMDPFSPTNDTSTSTNLEVHGSSKLQRSKFYCYLMSCYTESKNYACKYKCQLILCISVVLTIFFMLFAIFVPFKSPQLQKLNTISSIKPHFFQFGGFKNYCMPVEKISEFSNGKVTLSSNKEVSEKVTLAITEELTTTIDQYSIPNTTLRTGFSVQHFELFNSFVINGFNLEVDIETNTGGILNITWLRISKQGKRHLMKTENITLANDSVKKVNYSSNESGFYELSLRGYEGINGTLSGHASYSSCESNPPYPHNCSIVFQGDTKTCKVNLSTITSGYILLILDAHEYEHTVFSITTIGIVRLKDKDNTAAKSAMIAITSICGLITVVIILVWLLQGYRHLIQNRIRMWLQHDTETPDTSSASSNPANEHTPLIDIKMHEN